jgi:hypothetical protein
MLEGEGRKRCHTRALGVFKGESSSMMRFWGPFPWSFFSSLGLFFVGFFFFFCGCTKWYLFFSVS